MNKEKLASQLINKIRSSAKASKSQWLNPDGTKTRYFVIDNLLDKDTCQKIYAAFPKDAKNFQNLQSFKERKKTSSNLRMQKKILTNITYAFQDKRFIELISNIVGFQEIEPDPELYAGGLSMMVKGDFLNPHIDNSHDRLRRKYRRLNILYYVSPDWKKEYGGNLELWNEELTKPKIITAHKNRLVVMETNKTSWHSVSQVQVDKVRCCVSNYYYSNISPDFTEYSHLTSFTGRPEEKIKILLGYIDRVAKNSIFKVLKALQRKSSKNL
jgi:Rps23 Pro-64 3,4-dihydroxylase Tpa1-like proline 4-hydroxylase